MKTLLDQLAATDNISLGDPECLRALLARLCAYTMELEKRVDALEGAAARTQSSGPYFMHGGV